MSAAHTPTLLHADPWLTCEPQTSARLLRPLLRVAEQRLGREALAAIAVGQDTTLEVLEDPDRWFSAALVIRLQHALVVATSDPQITWRAGRAFAAPGMLGPERALIVGLGSPQRAYANIGSITKRYSRITHWQTTSIARGVLRVELVPSPDAADHLLTCAHRRGILEAMPEIFGLPAARVEHPACLHRGDPRCVYIVRWSDYAPWARPAFAGALVTALAALAAWAIDNPYNGALIAVSVAFTALGALGVGRPQQAPTEPHEGASAAELASLLDRSNRRVRELNALQRVIEASRVLLDEGALLDEVLTQLTGPLGFRRATFLRRAKDGTWSARGSEDDVLAQAGPTLARYVQGTPALIVDVATLDLPEAQLLRQAGHIRFAMSTVESGGSLLGLLLADGPDGNLNVPPTQRDVALLESLASTVGAAARNARLYGQVQEELLINQKFRQYLPREAVDAILRDPSAALRIGGHEESVVVLICDVAGFTRISSSCTPAEVVRGLNAWFEIADPVIAAAQGIIDKRLGDGILVIFRHDAGDHPVVRAARAAAGLQTVLHASRDRLLLDAPQFASMQLRYAIHYGKVILGNIGSSTRIEYTVIGDAVNTCARLEELTPAGEVWLTEDAVNAVGAQALGELVRVGDVVLRGRHGTTGLWRTTR